MTDGWDLHAVVRSCTGAAFSTNDDINTDEQIEEPFPNLPSPTFQNEDSPILDPDTDSRCQGLEEIYKELYARPQTITTPQNQIIGGFENQQQTQQIIQQQQPELNNSGAGSSFTFQPSNSQTIRSKRRKNQQAKTVHQMTQEELSTDSWAWRKYGQKPIKGSPYPRNYYRCSTSKGCTARKQVEQSSTDSTIFVVSYTGEHTHPRPTHRSSLAGSTRNKISTVNKSTSGVPTEAVPEPSRASSSPTSASSFSPTNPLMEAESAPIDDTQNLKEVVDIEDDDVEMEVDDDDEDVLIPNTVMSEEIFKGFQELGGGREGRSTTSGTHTKKFSSGMVFPP